MRISAIDPNRLLLLTFERRCTICGWKIGGDELCWYVSWPPAIDALRRSQWQTWDVSIEGVGHQECLMFSTLVCPFLADPSFERRTDQLRQGSVVMPKGTERGPLVLAGAPRAQVSFTPDGSFEVAVGGGEPHVIEFTHGSELADRYRQLVATIVRHPTDSDLAFVDLLVGADGPELSRSVHRALLLTAVAQGREVRLPGRNEPCVCGSGRKLKVCCLADVDRVRALLRDRDR